MRKGLILFSMIFGFLTFTSASGIAGSLPSKLPVKRGIASFTHGFKVTKKDCRFFEEPSQGARAILEVKSGRKIWMTAMDSQWLIAKTKRQARKVYVHKSCVL